MVTATFGTKVNSNADKSVQGIERVNLLGFRFYFNALTKQTEFLYRSFPCVITLN